jgi:hypothetical protein
MAGHPERFLRAVRSGAHLKKMKVSEIRLPVCRDGLPGWKLKECYVNSLPFSSQQVAFLKLQYAKYVISRSCLPVYLSP